MEQDPYEKRVYFESLQACNEDCLFCLQGGNNPDGRYFSTGEAKKKIEEFSKEGWEMIVFDGGEPTLRDDLPELIGYAIDEGLFVNVLTNGVRLSEDQYFNRIVEVVDSRGAAGKCDFSVSLHSHREEVSEYIVNTEDTFGKSIEGINNLMEEDLLGGVYHVITEFNYQDLPEFVRFVNNLTTDYRLELTFSFIFPEGSALENLQIIPDVSMVSPYLREALSLQNDTTKVRMSTCGVLPLCQIKGFEEIDLKEQQSSQSENLKIIDEDVVEGEDREYKLADDEYHKKTKTKKKCCSTCYLDSYCSGLWNFYEKRSEDVFKPVHSTDSYPVFELSPGNLDDNWDISNLDRGEIVFVKLRGWQGVELSEVEEAMEKIGVLDTLGLSYIVEKPLPFPEIDHDLRIPSSCSQCIKLVREDGQGNLRTCTGKEVEEASRSEAYRKFREDIKNGKSPECWMSDYITDIDSWPVKNN